MKKIVIILISILIALYIILSIVSFDKEYSAERLIYRAGKVIQKISVNPDVVPPAMFKSVESILGTVLKKYPKANAAIAAKMLLAEFYIQNKKYEKGIDVLNDIIKTQTQNPLVSSRAYFLKGNAYERQNKWSLALAEYIILKDKYSDTPIGMQMPLYIGNYYKNRADDAEAERAYNEAASLYAKMEKENHKKPFGYVAANFLIQAYISSNKYEQAAGAVEDIINNYPSLQTFAQQIRNIEFVIVKSLKDNKRAVAIYTKIRENAKDKEFKKFLDERIASLNK